jgi:hypothetical protein
MKASEVAKKLNKLIEQSGEVDPEVGIRHEGERLDLKNIARRSSHDDPNGDKTKPAVHSIEFDT